jgi:HK97 family phage prohead protease
MGKTYTEQERHEILKRARARLAQRPIQDANFAIWREEHREELADNRLEEIITRRAKSQEIIRKVSANTNQSGLEFILSDETIDAMSDIIEVKGWMLDDFRRNPIALFSHQKDFVVGVWENVSVRANALRGHLRLAPSNTSERISEVVKLVEANIIKSVSVGFRAIASTPIKGGGLRFTKSVLVECSLCAIGANPSALAVARSMVSPETVSLVFGAPVNELDALADEVGAVTGRMQIEIDRLHAEIQTLKNNRK